VQNAGTEAIVSTNWELEHENLIKQMAALVGAQAHDNRSINEALALVTDPAIRAEYDRLNKLNDEACEKAERQL
jgi:hypothetical protein